MTNEEMVHRFTIPIAPVTKKNHPDAFRTGPMCPHCKKRTGRIAIQPSKPYEQYEKDVKPFLKPLGISSPVNIKALYYMSTRRIVDLPNLHNALHDAFKAHGVVKDDESKIIAATDGSRVLHDPQHPRTEVEITYLEPEQSALW